MKQTKGTTAAGLTIRQAAEQIAGAGICAERTALDWLYTKRVPLHYLQQMERGRILIEPAELAAWIAANRKGGTACK